MDKITEIISEICVNYQVELTFVIYVIMIMIFLIVFCILIKSCLKLKNIKNVVDIVKTKISNEEVDEENIFKFERMKKNFPIIVQEIEDIYNPKKNIQISAIDVFENNLIIAPSEEHILRSLINSLTSFGLLGTFIGLISSVKTIDAQQTSEGIELLIKSIGPAISTTIFGVFLSLILSIILSSLKSVYKGIASKLAKNMMKERPSDTNPDYFYDSFTTFTGKKYETALKIIVDKFLEEMKSGLTEDLEQYKFAINDAITALSKNEEQFNTASSGLIGTVDKINKYLQETDKLNKNFEIKLGEFALALGDFNDNLKNSNKSTIAVLNNIEKVNKTSENINSSLEEVLKTELDEIKKSFELMKEMNISFKNEIMNTPLQIDSSIKNLCDSIDSKATNMEKLSNKLKEVMEQFDNIMKKNKDR